MVLFKEIISTIAIPHYYDWDYNDADISAPSQFAWLYPKGQYDDNSIITINLITTAKVHNGDFDFVSKTIPPTFIIYYSSRAGSHTAEVQLADPNLIDRLQELTDNAVKKFTQREIGLEAMKYYDNYVKRNSEFSDQLRKQRRRSGID